MNLADLLKAGTADGEIKPVKIDWQSTIDDKKYEAEVFIKIVSHAEQAKVISQIKGEVNPVSAVISTYCRFGDGSESLTYEQAEQLEPGIAYALYNAATKSSAKKKRSHGGGRLLV